MIPQALGHDWPKLNERALTHWGQMTHMGQYSIAQYNITTLLPIMACRLFGAKPLSEAMLSYCKLDPKKHISIMTFYSKLKSFHSCTWKCRLRNGGHFISSSISWMILVSGSQESTRNRWGNQNQHTDTAVCMFPGTNCPRPVLRNTRTSRCMMTSSNGNFFHVTGHLCGEFTGLRWIPHTKASDAVLWCKRLSKQWSGLWFERLSYPLWRHCNGLGKRRNFSFG